jgi:hypothetical protein
MNTVIAMIHDCVTHCCMQQFGVQIGFTTERFVGLTGQETMWRSNAELGAFYHPTLCPWDE